MDGNDVVNLVLGLLELTLALVVAVYLGRVGRTFPWLALLIVFFLLRGSERIYAAFAESDRFGILTDIVLISVVVMLIAGLGRTSRALKATHDDAALRQEEYDRALSDYRTLARHRLANPITAIRGSIVTLRELPDLDAATQRTLLAAIDEEAERLERIALDPQIASAEERGLDPRPNV